MYNQTKTGVMLERNSLVPTSTVWAVGAAMAFMVPLLLLVRQGAKVWRRKDEGWTAVANSEEQMLLTA